MGGFMKQTFTQNVAQIMSEKRKEHVQSLLEHPELADITSAEVAQRERTVAVSTKF